MPFEFTILDALQAPRCPVLDALAVFFDAAGALGSLLADKISNRLSNCKEVKRTV